MGDAGGERDGGDVDAKIAALGDWRGETLSQIRAVILAGDPAIVETVKWRKAGNPHGVPVWECDGIICTGETYKAAIKLTFANGAALKDPAKLFNASLDGNQRRAIDVGQGESIDADALTALVREAIDNNRRRKS